ncbi:MAG: hypothetical protein BGN97_01310 [Microbacterium sp. 69-10]|nr:MAG: hypothetical protein BGN97_01310 [Microbacterium sp. 69-10]
MKLRAQRFRHVPLEPVRIILAKVRGGSAKALKPSLRGDPQITFGAWSETLKSALYILDLVSYQLLIRDRPSDSNSRQLLLQLIAPGFVAKLRR